MHTQALNSIRRRPGFFAETQPWMVTRVGGIYFGASAMAGDWIKMRHDLRDDPAVIQLCEELKLGPDLMVGLLHRFWCWADRQLRNGTAVGVTGHWIDEYVGATGFTAGLCQVGWLRVTSNGFTVPNFNRHMSQSAKTRALTSKRVADYRKRSCNAPIVTREEKRREEKKREEKERKKEDSSEPAEAANSKPAVQAVMVFPIVGKGPKTWELTPEHLGEFEEVFPALPVLAEFGRAKLWLSNNPGRKKTAGGMARFLGSWLGRAQNAGQGEGVTPPKGSLCAGLDLERKFR